MSATRRARRLGAAVGVAVAILVVVAPAPASAAPAKAVVIAVLPSPPSATLIAATEPRQEPGDRVLRSLERLGFAIGLVSTAQGDYQREQAVLDLTQGTRQPSALYDVDLPPLLQDTVEWDTVVRRAGRVSVTIEPGLLAGSVPGGAAFVGTEDGDETIRLIAADREGAVQDTSIGDEASLAARVAEARARFQLVVVGLPDDGSGLDTVEELLEAKQPQDLLVVVHLPPTPPERPVGGKSPSRFSNQTAIGIAGGSGLAGELASPTTRQAGLVSLIDIAPTALDHLGVRVPDRMRGQVITVDGEADAGRLESVRRRWYDIRSGRQAGSLRAVVVGAAFAFLVGGAIVGIRRSLAPALRLVGLGLLWWPAAALAAAPFAIKSGPAEAFAIAAIALAASATTDRLMPWPKGPLVPAVVGIGVVTIDLAAGGRLLTTSVLGPSIATGNRFYGVSNEIEPILPVLLLAGIAAVTSRRHRLLYAVGGLFLAAVVGAGRLGADVGGVITISAAFAVAAVAMTPVRPRPRTLVAIAAVPVLALGLLIVADLALGGGGHLANNLTRASGTRELWELVARRYELAFRVLLNPANAVGLGVACLLVVFGYRNRDTLLPGELRPGRAWTATFVGGLAGGVAGALSNDSGPILLTNAVVALAAVGAYLRGRPASAAVDDTRGVHAERSMSEQPPSTTPPRQAVAQPG